MKRSIFYKLLFSLVYLFLFIPGLIYGQSDLFEIRTPNAMIIFDTSSSMNMDVNGSSVSIGNAKGMDGNTYNFEGGGNHPNSKLYQAKQALRDVIKNLENVNLGFATYGQRKQEKWRGYYKRWTITQAYQPPRNWCDKRYYRWTTTNDTSPRYATSFSSNSFKDAWGTEHTSVEKNVYTFQRKIWIHDKATYLHPPYVSGSFQATKEYWIQYKVTDITYNAEYNWYVFKYEVQSPSYDLYQEYYPRRLEPCGSCGPDTENAPFSRDWGTWKTYFSGEDEYKDPSNGRPKKWWDCTTGSSPEVKEKWDWQPQWRSYTGSDCLKPKDGEWEYVGNCYNVSEYYYPIGPSAPALLPDPNRPHTWSYFKIVGDIWPESIQQKPYYPALKDDPGNQDNHFFFTNFPEIDDSITGYETRNKIASWLDLTPFQSGETARWHTKLPLKANSITSNTIDSLYTPLADSLYQAKKYFNAYLYEYNGGDSASKSNCRGNYIILMTDGLESARFKGGNPDYDAAAQAAKELLDLVKDKKGNPAGVRTFVIGFGVGLKGNKPEVLDNIAKNGGTEHKNKKTGKTEYAYFAENLDDLKEAFKEIFLTIGTGYSRSNPVITSTRDRIYRGYFDLPGWKGHLVAFDLNTDGSIKAKIWDAGQEKDVDKSARVNVYTWDKDKNPKLMVFKEESAGKLKDLLNSPEEDIDGDKDIDVDDSRAIINLILNPGYDGGKYKGTRSPTWSLGDIYHSTPLLVGKPPFNFPDGDKFTDKYSDFKDRVKGRPNIIYVGVNDGMLYAFDYDGIEKFTVIPKNLLGKLRDLRNTHQFYVDSSPRAYDVYFTKKNEWRTVLVNGERGGGNYYFALDITDPDNPEVLWEQTDSNLGNTWSRPEIGRVKIGGQEKFVAFVGGGYSSTDNIGNTFYAIDIEDGTILRKFVVGNAKNKIPAGATAFDSDLDGRVNGVYFGDIQGTLWKIKIDGEEDITKWQLITLNTPGTNTPVFYPPAVTKNNQGKIMVYYGQGDELNIFEQLSSNSFFEVWDKGDSGQMIWEEKLAKGEKVLASPAVTNNVVYFTTWLYTGVSDNCGAGKGRLYGLTTTGLGVTGDIGALLLDPLTGAEMGSKKKYFEITDYFPEAMGIPSGPIVTNGMIYVSTSLNAGQVITIPIPGWGTGRLKYWREVF